ncbi:ethanolamine ammonia-lyase subunit EutC [Methylomonas sp. UP202]|uniref:ethanolamine ammonia-lyase subunit EutC n=1 Tax=Methylomonas sp. UP202 TaxID=3040943 RepID=UPI00247A152F|nr:ethanolamine ammonia-lyase subunit EutC [Methylomonas sp. UP202]WGS87136.1 ethanolamine ammonia-lyase subunit EutC [Methylomonas sp. UP202]
MSDPWLELRRYTEARIALGRAGCALPASAQLEFNAAHAAARDAVHQPWAVRACADAVSDAGWPVLVLNTPIADRAQYLRRPDLGRRLTEDSRAQLTALNPTGSDVALIFSNGLSSTAVERHAFNLLQAVTAAYRVYGLTLAPICLVPEARVAVADEIGELLQAKLAVIIVGERPGLSAADSLGIYLTHAPRLGNTDADRNCLSNIRPPQGLAYEAAAIKLAYLSAQALRRGLSGVALKDDMPSDWLPTSKDANSLDWF